MYMHVRVLISTYRGINALLSRGEIDYYLWPALNYPQSTTAAARAAATPKDNPDNFADLSLTYRNLGVHRWFLSARRWHREFAD